MTVLIKIGRRVPRNWFKRQANKMRGLLTFQENMWMIIERSMTMAKKKATQSGNLNFVKRNYREPEDINFDLEWIEIVIDGNPNQEQEEYEEAMCMYKNLGNVFKNDFPVDEKMTQPFKSSRLTPEQLKKAYEHGYGAMENKSISQKLLELGIVTYIEKFEPKREEPRRESGQPMNDV